MEENEVSTQIPETHRIVQFLKRNKVPVTLIGAGLVIAVLCLLAANLFLGHTPSSRVVVTSGKITELGGYERVWVDPEGEYAVYVKANYTASQLRKGSVVTIGGQLAEVVSSTNTYFYVSVKEDKGPYIPGTPVSCTGGDVGFVSGIDENLNIKCYYY